MFISLALGCWSGIIGQSLNEPVGTLPHGCNARVVKAAVYNAVTHVVYNSSRLTTASAKTPGSGGSSIPVVQTWPASVTFPSISLSGDVQTVSATLPNMILYSQQAGTTPWKVSVRAVPLTEIAPSSGFAPNTSAVVLPSGSLSLSIPSQITVTSHSGASYNLVNQAAGTGTSMPIDTGAAVTVVLAASEDKLSTYSVDFGPMSFIVSPAAVSVDAVNYPSGPTPYQSTLDWSISVGP